MKELLRKITGKFIGRQSGQPQEKQAPISPDTPNDELDRLLDAAVDNVVITHTIPQQEEKTRRSEDKPKLSPQSPPAK